MYRYAAAQEFVDYVLDFYGPNGVYPMGATNEQVEKALDIYLKNPETDYAADSFDRENIRDILISEFGLTFPNKSSRLNQARKVGADKQEKDMPSNELKRIAHKMQGKQTRRVAADDLRQGVQEEIKSQIQYYQRWADKLLNQKGEKHWDTGHIQGIVDGLGLAEELLMRHK